MNQSVTGVPDDLLTPSLQETGRVDALPRGERPWRLSSQFYVAFFGGALAVAALAWVNAGRLRADDAVRKSIVAAGALGVVVSVVASYLLYGNDAGSSARFGYRIVGVGLSLVLFKLQKSADRVYSFRTHAPEDELYDSMVRPGLLAVIVGGLLQLGIVFGGIALIGKVA